MASPGMREADYVTDISCETRSSITKFTCTWTIHDFSLRREDTGQKIDSTSFSTPGSGNKGWSLQLYPNGQSMGSKDFVSVYVVDVTQNCFDPCILDYKFAVIDEEGQRANVKKATSRYSRGGLWGFEKFVERTCLLKSTARLLPNDKLTIRCEVLGIVNSGNTSSQHKSGAVRVPDCHLSQDLGSLLVSRRFSDVILSVGGEEIHAHKNVLAARCPVFAAMFEHEMKENEQGRVEITDCDFEVFREVVEFIYTGRAPKLNEMTERILAVANKYDLGRLKALCEEVLHSKLSLGTAAQTLILADMHNAEQLKANTLQFIKTHAAGVIKTDGWKMMASEKPQLVEEGFCALVL